ncbi:Co2+/Mg2+ efflux protein ApaG [Chryseobacterium sp. MFBS3-17]|uniref:Co2+/Mg2+ efflux protein ApaG n=1 Tax=Chryseobacterium sp. MFBS3-17 TaxID=2886689 RepID=UPI001D0E13E0|nr:Co2+/Mg2+ efflux protein ApaG [Chryseobacterium sp. MFBS3-17]MCC2590286.1 Co2+/Mg2+ efflux protein ApaG [Chryseobacterium sp. MFBS3-17]
MFSKTTSQIKVTVVPEYDGKNSFPTENRFVFRYNVTIENFGSDAIVLQRRSWLIYDVGFGFTEVQGEGVIGLTPEIPPGGEFKYFSNVMIRSGIGNMYGMYSCRNVRNGDMVEVDIPKFNLIANILNN